MILKQLTIQNLGAIERVTHHFEDGCNTIKCRRADEIAYAIPLLLGHRVPPLPSHMARADTRIEAQLLLAGKQYDLVARPSPTAPLHLCLRAYDRPPGEGGEDVTAEYLHLSAHCPEQDLSEILYGESEDTPLRPIKYRDEDIHFAARELSARTQGRSDSPTFRAYLRAYLRDFKPDRICDGKQYAPELDRNGRYVIRHRDNEGRPVWLSEAEQQMFRFLCFLKTVEFWHGFEQIRDLHSVKKPLLIERFWDRIDASVSTRDLTERAADLGRQIIILEAQGEKP